MNTNTRAQLLEAFLELAIKLNLLEKRDRIYMRNRYYSILNLKPQPELIKSLKEYRSLTQICNELFATLDNKQLEHLGHNPEQRETEFINLLLPLPSSIENKFHTLLEHGDSKVALAWYYSFCQQSNYIKVEELAKNITWYTATPYGPLQITVNLSKPEKDPAEIAKAGLSANKATPNYPLCLLCIENEGFKGNSNHPARQTHRMIKLKLNQQEWYFQFSPYAYYPEHSIILNSQHVPMLINLDTLKIFFDFVDLVPHYLIGSNSDIPIVGGSILTHDHFQAGNHQFPIESATVKFNYKVAGFKDSTINYLNWPISTLRLDGNKQDLLRLAELIIHKWYHFAKAERNIMPFSNKGVRHNAITPILRKMGADKYHLYIMLRNNRISKEYPDGIFHPHQHLHHIKKENIGLIEAMGLAVLPGRLAYELAEIEKLLLFNDKNLALTELLYDQQLLKHEEWLVYLYDKYQTFDAKNVTQLLKVEVGEKFREVLEDCGVFKHNAEGDLGLKSFLASLEI